MLPINMVKMGKILLIFLASNRFYAGNDIDVIQYANNQMTDIYVEADA